MPFTDKDGDPHSPHVGHGDGVGGVFTGLWLAHTGWLLSDRPSGLLRLGDALVMKKSGGVPNPTVT